MRKIYKLAAFAGFGLMLSTQNINAQTVSDFENLTLNTNSYWDGSDMSGNHNNKQFTSTFISGDANYVNVFDTTYGAAYGYWLGGFAYSNMTDSVTSGSANRFSSRAGSGANSSSNYIVSQNNSTIVLTGAAANNNVNGLYVANSTYAANSMRDGDSFAKQFGGVSGNDPDWFLLTIKGYNSGNLTNDSVNFYLADYRFTNNSQDYIVKDWQWVDLSSLGNIDSVYFMLTSSDTGSFGMNTPGIFCIDNFNDQSVGVAMTINKNEFKLYPNPASTFINVEIEKNKEAVIFDVAGKVITRKSLLKGKNRISIDHLKPNIYFVRIGSEFKKLIIQ